MGGPRDTIARALFGAELLMYLSRCDPALLTAVPHGTWSRFPWSDDSMEASPIAVDDGWDAAVGLVPELWGHFELANESLGHVIALVEIGRLKRYADGASCPAHVDDPQPLSHGRRLSLTAVVDATDDLSGGALVVERNDGRAERVDLRPGDVAVFPSAARHWVEPVTRGVRTVLVARALSGDGHAAGQWLWNPDGTTARKCVAPTRAEMREYRGTLAMNRRARRWRRAERETEHSTWRPVGDVSARTAGG